MVSNAVGAKVLGKRSEGTLPSVSPIGYMENKKGLYADTNPQEYWAEGAVMWFYEIGPGRQFESYDAFFGRDRLLAELLDEWFPRVSFWEYF